MILNVVLSTIVICFHLPLMIFIALTKLVKPRLPWLLVAMSHIFTIMATSALKFSSYKSDENNEDAHL